MILALVLAASLPSVDPAVREVRACRLNSISFRTPVEGWVSDACGHVYKTTDGGRGWARDTAIEKLYLPEDEKRAFSSGHLEFMRWFGPTEAIAGGYIGGRVLRTKDGGKSWAEVRANGLDQWIYSAFVRGSTIWVCGSGGTIARSDDRGQTWATAPSPFDDRDRCFSLAFRADHTGEATGLNGSRWTTKDDGKTWTNVTPAQPDSLSTPRIFATGSQSEKTSTVAGLTASIDEKGRLVFERANGPKQIVPLRTPGSAERVALLGIEPREGGKAGWTASDLFLSDDTEAWYWVGALPSAAQRVTFVARDAVVLETAGGVYRSESGGRDWKKSAQPELDRNDAEVARGKPSQPNPLACVATAKNAKLNVKLGVQGCFGGSEHGVSIAVTEGAATLNGKPMPKLADLVRTLGDRMLQLERPMGCSTTTMSEATVSWTCDGAAEQRLHFESYGCGSQEGVGASTSFRQSADTGYARAIGIHALVGPLVDRP